MHKTYDRAAARNVGTSRPDAGEHDAAKAAITNLFENLETVLEGQLLRACVAPCGKVTGDSHFRYDIECDSRLVLLSRAKLTVS